ncbi:hypothetical protein PENNAL_c0051G09921 [Penicillium nalgiovense]|uniref:Uncharacterized protein n=1 Tax=Penicillium nalgiovense TaxID=60175 RepID=A0A1V6XW94_PENNA|nr:hypothetical protein PENNAL_c0051G09921 [Penicillium nalgiovense]
MAKDTGKASQPNPSPAPKGKHKKTGHLSKMKAHKKAIKKRKWARITACYNALAEHYLQQGGSAHPEEMRNRCLKIIHDMAVLMSEFKVILRKLEPYVLFVLV